MKSLKTLYEINLFLGMKVEEKMSIRPSKIKDKIKDYDRLSEINGQLLDACKAVLVFVPVFCRCPNNGAGDCAACDCENILRDAIAAAEGGSNA